MTNNNNGYDTSKASWLARGLEQLLDTGGGDIPSYDVVIVGSGYGGAIAASTLAGRQKDGNTIKVCVLERGQEYLPGMFPTGLTELPTYFRMGQNKEGLFDARPGPEVTTLVANGVGGGSLINAGVMEVPREDVFQQRWPTALSDLSTWKTYYEQAQSVLGAGTEANPNTIQDHVDEIPLKTQALQDIADPSSSFRYAAITVAMDDSESSARVNLNKCVLCGDCATGCNFGAKISLDVSLLATAHRRGVDIYRGATVLSVEKDNSEWLVNTVYTNATLRKIQHENGGPAQIRAKKVILAAGTLGSTEILQRSTTLNFSSELGRHCSTNGDMLVTDYATRDTVNTVANENIRPSEREIGPTITGVVDLRDSHGVLIEEMSVPAGIRRVFTEIFATTNTLHRLNEADHSTHENGFPNNDIYAVRHDKIDRSALYAVMGDDGAAGTIQLQGAINYERDGIGTIRWAGVQDINLFDTEVETVTNLTQGTGGDVIANPVWNLLPPEMSFLLDNEHGPVVTVHPLGGCVMADSVAQGVVDDLGQVYDPGPSETYHDGLVVLDGAIIPTALGTNPALTITAVALRATQNLASQWGYLDTATVLPSAIDRPVARNTDVAFEPEGTTEIQVCERMHGDVNIRDTNDRVHRCVVELTMRFEETPISVLTYPNEANPAELTLDTTQDGAVTASRIRIFDRDEWDTFQLKHVSDRSVDDELEALAIYRAPLDSGTLSVFMRRESNQFSRAWRSGRAYLANRGWRDIWQALADPSSGAGGFRRGWQRFIGGLRLSTRAGEKRWLRYELRIGSPDAASTLQLRNNEIVGRKRFTYRRRANPWRQLMRMRLRRFPGLRENGPRVLGLDPQYLTRIGIPLIRITRQADGVTALAELGSFLMYLVRFLLGIQIWCFRRPDYDPDPAPVDRLPRDVPDIPVPHVEHMVPIGLEVPDGDDSGVQVDGNARLALYEYQGAAKPPILMLHGYSASGTTFAHHSIPEGLAQRLHASGRDVWVADLRTSAGMPTARNPWSMEQIGYRDIPEVIDYIYEYYQTAVPKIDVLAHCMGSVMFSMCVLRDDDEVLKRGYTAEQRQKLNYVPRRINRVAFTQVGPLVVFSPANRFRAYAIRFLRGLLPEDYDFNPPSPPSLADQLVDRILATLPYPLEEYETENPTTPWKRTPWTRTRHRMDALYGRDFNVTNVSDDMLRHINDHFGPLSVETVTQTMHFARYNTIADRTGYNSFVSRETLVGSGLLDIDKRWEFPVLSVHGRDNGLSDVTTVDRMQQILADAGRNYRSHIIYKRDVDDLQNAGHQDALIGRGRHETADELIAFFDDPGNLPVGVANNQAIALTPWMGPVFTAGNDPGQPVIRIGAAPVMREPISVVMLPVQVVDGEMRRHNDGMPFDAGDAGFIASNMVTYSSNDFSDNRWDAFDMPLPPAVPSGGDGLLVLVTYLEAATFPMGVAAFHAVHTNQYGVPEFVIEIDPSNWNRDPPDPSLPPPDVSLQDMLDIAESVLITLRQQRVSGNPGGQIVVDPVPVAPPAIVDPSGTGPGSDPVE